MTESLYLWAFFNRETSQLGLGKKPGCSQRASVKDKAKARGVEAKRLIGSKLRVK